MKEALPIDGFLGNLHMLMLLNEKNTKLFVINPEAADKISLNEHGWIVIHMKHDDFGNTYINYY